MSLPPEHAREAELNQTFDRTERNAQRLSLAIAFLGLGFFVLGSWSIPALGQFNSVFVNVGGAFFGAGMAMVLRAWGDAVSPSEVRKGQHRIERMIAESRNTGSHMLSAASGSDVTDYRAEWHHYHATLIGGVRRWRHRVYDFRGSKIPQILNAEISATDGNGRKHNYCVEARIEGDRCVSIERKKIGSEPPVIEVYPGFTSGIPDHKAGIAFIETWDGPEIITPCLFSIVCIGGYKGEDDLPESVATQVEEIWKAALSRKNRILLPQPTVPNV